MPRITILWAFFALLSACKHDATSAAASATSTPSAAPSAAPASSIRGSFPIPTGPRLAIVAGEGIGPIRLGAKLATIERLMDAPCDEKNDKECRYIARAVVFDFGPDGKTTRIRVQRMGRAAGNGKVYGIFNGAIPPDLRFDMIPQAVQQYLGPPEKVVQGNQGAGEETAEQHVYKGMVLEYDRLENKRLVLGGVRIPD